MNNLGKILIFAVIIIAVVAVIVLKNQPQGSESAYESETLSEKIEVPSVRPQDLFSGSTEEQPVKPEQEPEKESEIAEKAETKPAAAPVEKTVQKVKPKAEGDVLAVVNGESITKSRFEEDFRNLPRQYRDMFKNNKDGYLDQLVMQKLLVQTAIEKGYLSVEGSSEAEQSLGIQQLFAGLADEIEISESEMKQFYRENIDQMSGASFEAVQSDIRSYLEQQKQSDQTEQYMEDLQNSADIVLNEAWVAEQKASRPQNPLTKVLGNGLPTVLDLGADNCIPCKMMKPIFAELEEELEGKANILILEIADYRDLGNEYQVRVIPTQIFFDQAGKQYWRHEGFLSKEDIIAKIKETGAEL